MLTLSEYNILEAIIDKNNKTKGVIALYGTTKKEIEDKTSLSKTKIFTALQKFENQGLVKKGLKQGNSNSYYLTEEGLLKLKEIKGM